MPVILLSVGCLKALKTLKGPYLEDGIRGGSRGTHEVVHDSGHPLNLLIAHM